jgi:hypothetical protein
MGAKNFQSINDWGRHGMNLHLERENGPCSHFELRTPGHCSGFTAGTR